jgi:serine/threonine-protein kinase RsbW
MTGAAPATFRVEAGVASLADVRAFVRAQLGAADAEAETVADVVQAVDELVCNVLEHGYDGRPGWVEVEIAIDDDAFTVRIRDAAPVFDPTTVPEPPLDLPLAKRKLGGMGVHLARALTDEFRHRILPGGGNEVTIRKRRKPTEARDGHHDRLPGV